MAFRKKAAFISKYKPDILIVPECEHPHKLLFDIDSVKPTQSLWFGENKNKGLGIFAYGDYKIKLLKDHNDDFKLIIPVAVTGNNIKFNLFAIWAHNPIDKDGKYITQVWKAINYYKKLMISKPSILIGDFNSNSIWDKEHKIDSHSIVVSTLAEMGIFSTYHSHHNQIQGTEKHPTFFLYKHLDKPFHLDYCFASTAIFQKLKSVEIGKHKQWSKHSDHCPLIVTFKD